MARSLEQLRQALQQTPNDCHLLLEIAKQALAAKLVEEADSYFRKLLQLNPTSKEGQIGLANVLFIKGKISESAVRLENLLLQHPEDGLTHLWLARIAQSEKNKEGALYHWRKACKGDPSLYDSSLSAEFGNDIAAISGKSQAKEVEPNWAEEEEDIEVEITENEKELSDHLSKEQENFEAPENCLQIEDFRQARFTLADVVGMDAAARDLQSLLGAPSEEMLEILNNRSRGGALLYGPPGCGKSLLAEAIAGSAGIPFLAVELHHILDAYVGNAEKTMHDLFYLARKQGPVVLFLDELDSLASERSQQKFAPTRTLLSQLLLELDRLPANSGTLVIGATNHPWSLDGSLLRAGRLGHHHFIAPPSLQERAQLLKNILKKVARDREDVTSTQFNQTINELILITENFSSADLHELLLNWIANKKTELDIHQLLLAAKMYVSEVFCWKNQAKLELKKNSAAALRFPALSSWIKKSISPKERMENLL